MGEYGIVSDDINDDGERSGSRGVEGGYGIVSDDMNDGEKNGGSSRLGETVEGE